MTGLNEGKVAALSIEVGGCRIQYWHPSQQVQMPRGALRGEICGDSQLFVPGRDGGAVRNTGGCGIDVFAACTQGNDQKGSICAKSR